MHPKQALRRLTRSALGTGAGLAALRHAVPDAVAVFLWHSVGQTPVPFFDKAGIEKGESSHCPIDAFEAQLDWIAGAFRVVPLDEAIEAARGGSSGYGWLAALTFDDGFRNVAEEAVPRLCARHMPSTIFVNSALADQVWVKDVDIRNMGDAAVGKSREAIAAETRAYATWDLLRALPPSVTFGNHGARHLQLASLNRDEAAREIEDGRYAIQRELGIERMPYAFTFGQPSDINGDARRLAAASHTCVMSAFGGFSWPGANHLDVPRVPVFSSADPALLVEYTFPPRFLLQRLGVARVSG